MLSNLITSTPYASQDRNRYILIGVAFIMTRQASNRQPCRCSAPRIGR